LTSFGGEVLVAPNTIDFAAVKQTMENPDPSDLLVLFTVCSVSLVYFLVLLFARRADKKDIVKVFALNGKFFNGCSFLMALQVKSAYERSGP